MDSTRADLKNGLSSRRLMTMNQRAGGDGEPASKRDGLDASSAEERMRLAIGAATMGTVTPIELESAARELVVQLRAANEPPEQVLLRIKRILAQAGLRPGHAPDDPTVAVDRHSSVYRNIIAWCIQHYFQMDGTDGESAGAI